MTNSRLASTSDAAQALRLVPMRGPAEKLILARGLKKRIDIRSREVKSIGKMRGKLEKRMKIKQKHRLSVAFQHLFQLFPHLSRSSNSVESSSLLSSEPPMISSRFWSKRTAAQALRRVPIFGPCTTSNVALQLYGCFISMLHVMNKSITSYRKPSHTYLIEASSSLHL